MILFKQQAKHPNQQTNKQTKQHQNQQTHKQTNKQVVLCWFRVLIWFVLGVFPRNGSF
jgi:uncharacterized ion transporter superfamily protein YfcC